MNIMHDKTEEFIKIFYAITWHDAQRTT